MRVSVIIPTHDRSDHLAGALDSVAAQRLAPHEVLVVDDLPSGRGRATVDAWSAAHDELAVRYVENPEGDGPSGSRNLGAARASGDWLAFLDDDDRWDDGHLSQVQRLAAGADVVLSPLTRTVLDTDGEPVLSSRRTIRPLTSAEDIVGRNPGVTGSNLAIRRSAFTTLDGYDPALTVAEDTDLLVQVLRGGLRVVVGSDSTSHQVVHQGERLSAGGPRRLHGMAAYLRKYYPTASAAARRRLQFRYWGACKDAATTRRERWRYRLFEWTTSRPTDLVARAHTRARTRLHRLVRSRTPGTAR